MPVLITLESTLVWPEGRPILGPGGEPVDRILKPVNSWVKQFPQILKAGYQSSNEANVLDVGAVARTVDHDGLPQFDASAPAGDDTHGILVGTSTTAPTSTDTDLNIQIADGSAAGQLDYQAMIFPSIVVIAGGRRAVCSRQLDNNSGGLITVEEIAIVVRQATTSGVELFLILHDLITSAIADGTARVFTYNLEFLV